MSRIGTLSLKLALSGLVSLLISSNALAATTGGHSLSFLAGIDNTTQEHLNTMITRANTRAGGISTSAMNTGYEAAVQYGYRFSGSMYALMLRPSFYYQVSKGSASSGTYDYGVLGFTFFPIFRIYPLENSFMKFFMQMGLGYGRANGSIEEATAKAEFAGDAFGTVLGMGTEFCFVPNHCLTTEANYRYLKMERNILSSVNGTFAADSLSNPVVNREVELDDTDLAVRMSGLQFLLGYAFYF